MESPTDLGISREVMQDGLPEGSVLDGCRIEELIGRGGMGSVYRAHHIALDRPVALKVLPAQFVEREDLLQRFQAEARAVARLEHANIVQVFNFGVKYGHPYIVMQLLEGESLGERLKRDKQLDHVCAFDYFAQAARGLAVAHEAGIIHRDIKPDNVFVTTGDVVKILDFGLAKEVESDVKLSQAGLFVGTPAYASPEQARHDESITTKTDIYSLGITLFQALTGDVPYTGPLYSILAAHAHKPLPSMQASEATVPVQLEELVLDMCEKKADDRPADMDEVADRLELMYVARASEANASKVARLAQQLDKLQASAKAAAGRRARRLRREVRRKIARGLGMVFLALVLVAGIIGVFQAFVGTPAADTGRTSEEQQAAFEAIVRRAKANPDADKARLILIDLDTFLSQAPEYQGEADALKPELDAVIEEARPIYDRDCESLLERAAAALESHDLSIAEPVLADIDKFLDRAPEYRDRFAEVRPELESTVQQARREASQRNEYESILRRASEATDVTKARLVLEDLDAFVASAPGYAQRLAETRHTLDALVTEAEEALDLERVASDLMHRAQTVIDPGLARMVLADLVSFLEENPDFAPRFEGVQDVLDAIVAAEAEQAERQLTAAGLYARVIRCGTDVEAGDLLAELDRFVESAPEFEGELLSSRRRLLSLIARAEERHRLDQEAEYLERQALDALASAEPPLLSAALSTIERFLNASPEYRDRLSESLVELEQAVASAARLAALGQEAEGIMASSRNVRRASRARAVLQAIEIFVGRAPEFESYFADTRDRLTALIMAETITPDRLDVPADVAGFPWQMRRFLVAGPFALADVLGDTAFQHNDIVTSLDLSDDGEWAISGSRDGTARIWHVPTGREARVLEAHTGSIQAVALDPTARFAITGAADASARVWETASGRMLHTHRFGSIQVTAVAYSPAGDTYAIALADGSVRIYEANKHASRFTIRRHVGAVNALAYSPTGSRLLTAGSDHVAAVWEVRTAQNVSEFTGHAGAISAAVLTAQDLALTASDDLTTRVWDANTGEELRVLTGHTLPVLALDVSPDGELALTGSADMTARLWRLADGETVHVFEGHSHYVSAVALSPAGQTALTASWDGTLASWSVESGERIPVGQARHRGAVSAVSVPLAAEEDLERPLYSAALDGTVMAWPARGSYGRRVAALQRVLLGVQPTQAGELLAITEDGAALRVLERNGEILAESTFPVPEGGDTARAPSRLLAVEPVRGLAQAHAMFVCVDDAGRLLAVDSALVWHVLGDGFGDTVVAIETRPPAGGGESSQRIAIVSPERLVVVDADLATWQFVERFRSAFADDGSLRGVALSQSGRYLATAEASARAGHSRVLDVDAGEWVAALRDYVYPIVGVRFVESDAIDERRAEQDDDLVERIPLVLVASREGHLRLIDPADSSELVAVELHEAGVRATRLVWIAAADRLVVATDRGLLFRFDFDADALGD